MSLIRTCSCILQPRCLHNTYHVVVSFADKRNVQDSDARSLVGLVIPGATSSTLESRFTAKLARACYHRVTIPRDPTLQVPLTERTILAAVMATSSKQYKAIGEDLWKGRTEKIVRYASPSIYCC